MNRINSSRQSTSASQRNCNYHPTFDLAPHVKEATSEIFSLEPVIFENGQYFVASKFIYRYYRVTEVDGVWTCSAKDSTVAKMMIARAQAYSAVAA